MPKIPIDHNEKYKEDYKVIDATYRIHNWVDYTAFEGQYQIPFQIAIPENLPSSFKEWFVYNGTAVAMIKYGLYARLNTSSGSLMDK
jgi:hypothetical protein